MDKSKVKLKSKKLSSSESTASGGKYKKFLTSILSPSIHKKHSKKKRGKSVHLEERNDDADMKIKNTEGDAESIGSMYSTIRFPPSHQTSVLESNGTESVDSMPQTQTMHEPNLQVEYPDPMASGEPLYATVNKKKKVDSSIKKSESLSLLQAKENSKLLQDRLKEIAEENRQLRKQAEDFVKEEKRKDDTFHAKLQLEITQLEAETRKEVKTLTDRIHMLLKEKTSLNDQIDILHQEKKEMQLQCDVLKEEKRTMVATEHHSRIVEGLKKVLKEATEGRVEVVNGLKQQCEALEEKSSLLTSQVQELGDKLSASQTKCEALAHENQKVLQEKAELLAQVEESRHMEQEGQKLILSLLKVSENLALERDALLNKASFQDNQQKELQTTVVDYSLNIGRLQEHIANLNKENIQELLKVKSSRYHEDDSLHQLHSKQLDILRSKVMEQNNIINEMENEKRKLELHLESLMESSFDKSITHLNA